MERAETQASSPPKVRVLTAEDEQKIADTLGTILELAGYEFCAVYSGEAARCVLDMFQPDLVITNLSTPGVPGLEVGYAARACLPRCKILLFTAHAGFHELLRTKELAALPFEVVAKASFGRDLLLQLRSDLCSERPTLLIPIELDDSTVH